MWKVLLVLPVILLLGCSDDKTVGGPRDVDVTPPSESVLAFVAEEDFEFYQYTTQLLDWNDVEFFYSAYGPGHDCPSGCIYSGAYGLHYGGRVGWIGYENLDGHEYSIARDYDFIESDTILFDVDTWFVLIYHNWWACFDRFLPALAGDEDTSRNALLAMSTLLYTHESLQIAEVLVENPRLVEDGEILGILAALPDLRNDMYLEVRIRAQELLDGLEAAR